MKKVLSSGIKGILLCILWIIVVSTATAQNRHARFGKPISPTPYVAHNADDFHVERDQYVLSHNGSRGNPNWVAWNLRKSDLGDAQRGDFERDPDLPRPGNQISASWFEKTGFDIGHMCPSKDRSASREDNDATFLMSNVVPQAPICNQQTWRVFEDYCRRLATDGRDLHIVCGPAGTRGQGKNGFANNLSEGRVNVPSYLWKVIIVLPDEKSKPDRATRVIAAIVPNSQNVRPDWTTYRCSAKHAEEISGWKCFPAADIDREMVDVAKQD